MATKRDMGEFYCDGCNQGKDTEEGYSLNGYGLFCCEACWKALRPFERLLLKTLVVHEEDEAGATLSAEGTLHEIELMLEKLFRATHGHPSYEVCRLCGPEAYQRLVDEDRKRRETPKAKES